MAALLDLRSLALSDAGCRATAESSFRFAYCSIVRQLYNSETRMLVENAQLDIRASHARHLGLGEHRRTAQAGWPFRRPEKENFEVRGLGRFGSAK